MYFYEITCLLNMISIDGNKSKWDIPSSRVIIHNFDCISFLCKGQRVAAELGTREVVVQALATATTLFLTVAFNMFLSCLGCLTQCTPQGGQFTIKLSLATLRWWWPLRIFQCNLSPNMSTLVDYTIDVLNHGASCRWKSVDLFIDKNKHVFLD